MGFAGAVDSCGIVHDRDGSDLRGGRPRLKRRAGRADIRLVGKRKRKTIQPRQLLWRTIPFALAGLLVGIPISYYFQSGIVRMLFSCQQYTLKVLAAAPDALWKQVNTDGSSADPFGVIAVLTTTLLITVGASLIMGWRLTAR